ncbi:hypothetical protein ACKC9G_00720 [Pokkaliibacter sp. CJK22405]|uniref:hypothetical protein n=1 Tax=Pokkaliibacter sp. CJK22405 TaxID=3384615 RepID=UPI003984BD56
MSTHDALKDYRQRHQQNSRRGFRERTFRKSDSGVDQQILRLHEAMVEKVLAEPALVAKVRKKLDERYFAGQLRHGAYLYWFGLLDNIDNAEQFREGVLTDNNHMRRLRRRSPFVGILSEEEREAILTRFNEAPGQID